MNRPNNELSSKPRLISRLPAVLWWVSIIWLILAAALIVWTLAGALRDPDNPLRHEYAIIAGIVWVYSWPAALGAAICSLLPRRFLSVRKRLAAAGLLIFCIVATVALDYLV